MTHGSLRRTICTAGPRAGTAAHAAAWTLLVTVASMAPAYGQQSPAAGGTRVAVVDTQRLLEESAAGRGALERLRGLFDQKQQEIAAREQEIADLRQQLEEGSLSLSEARQAELQGQVEDKLIALRRLRDDAQRELNQQQDRAMQEIDRQIMPVIQQVAAESGYALIFRKYESGLLFAQDAVDITDRVLQRFNAAAGERAPAQEGEGDSGGDAEGES